MLSSINIFVTILMVLIPLKNCTKVYFYEDDHKNMHNMELIFDNEGELRNCIASRQLERTKDAMQLDTENWRLLNSKCSFYSENQRTRRGTPDVIILPGMKWCGKGNIAKNYSDLGKSAKADACCRTHDHCDIKVPSKGTFKGLKNNKIYTMNHCSCDSKLRQCLTDVKNLASNTVGELFFNVLQIKCIDFNYPITKCLEYNGLFGMSCQKYELNTTATKAWRIYDQAVFKRSEIANFTVKS